MDMTIAYGAGMFTAIILALVLVILAARSRLVASGNISIEINGERTIEVPAGGKLLQTLAGADLFLASACGGGGTCAQCKCVVEEGGGAMLPTEESFFTRREANEGWRLSCQTPVGLWSRVLLMKNYLSGLKKILVTLKSWQLKLLRQPLPERPQERLEN